MKIEKAVVQWLSYSLWTHAFLKTLGGLVLLGFAFLGALLLQHWGFDPTIASTPMLLVIALVALFWGTMPALMTLLASVVALDYLILEPVGTFHIPTGKVFMQLLPFLVSGVIIAILTAQREHARHLAKSAQKDAERYADEVEQDTLLREIVLSSAADVIQEKVIDLVQASCESQQQLPEDSDPHMAKNVASAETADEKVKLIQRLIADLPSLKTIHSSTIFFDQSPPYDLYDITQALIEELRYGDGREITLQLPSAPVILLQDIEQVSVILICLLRYTNGAFPVSEHISIHLEQDSMNIIIRLVSRVHEYEHCTIPLIDQSMKRTHANLWWLICQACVKRQGGQLTFHEGEHVWTVLLPREKPQAASGSTVVQGTRE